MSIAAAGVFLLLAGCARNHEHDPKLAVDHSFRTTHCFFRGLYNLASDDTAVMSTTVDRFSARPRGTVTTQIFHHSSGMGGQAAAAALETLRHHESAIWSCHIQALRRDTPAEGHVDVVLTTDDEGFTKSAHIRHSSVPDGLERCVVRQVRGYQFAPSVNGGAILSIRYRFSQHES
jgi:outer membrane biosynthesis protein TonB